LICAPSLSTFILMIDGKTDGIILRPCIDKGGVGIKKWSGIAQYGTKLFCSPALHPRILVLEDQTLQLSLNRMRKSTTQEGQIEYVESMFLIDYIKCRNIPKLEELLKSNVDPNSQKDGITALQFAVREGNQEAVEMLLKYNASTAVTPCIVTDAIQSGHDEIAKTLGKWGASYSVLVDYARDGNIEKMQELFTKFNVNPDSLSEGTSALQAAIHEGQQEAVQLLLDNQASTDNSNSNEPIMQQALDFSRSITTAQLLFNEGASCDNVGLSPRMIPLGDHNCDNSDWKWAGLAPYSNKVFYAPHHAPSVLVVDGESEEIRSIPCTLEGKKKWMGIARCGNKLFCSPYNASCILVIDGDTEEMHTIECNDEGEKKWHGIAVYGTKLFCAPYRASSVLVIDGETEEISFIPVNIEGLDKWTGIALCGNKLFCAPYLASSILVIDAESHQIHTVRFDRTITNGNYTFITCYNNKRLYCAPWHESSVLVIDGETEETRKINTGVKGGMKWLGVAQFEAKLYFSPCWASAILVVNGETDEVSHLQYHQTDSDSTTYGFITLWNDKKLICSVYNADNILVLEDRRYELSGFIKN